VAVSIPNALNTSHFIKETHPSIPLCRLGSLTGTWVSTFQQTRR